MKKETIIQLVIILILIVILGVLVFKTVELKNSNQPQMMQMQGMGMQEENTVKDTTADDVDSGKQVNTTNIDLSSYTSNITITEAGNYTLTGSFKNSVLVNSEGEVTLNLNNITIENSITAAIANISQNDLTINLIDNTTNKITDGGSSEYDACLYSNGNLIIEGNGSLYVYGNQEEGEGIATEAKDITINGGNIYIECADDGLNAGGDGATITVNDGSVYIKASGDGIDSNKDLVINGGVVYSMGSSIGGDAGIDTDGGYSINGGTVVALGSDMLVTPVNSSKQNTICFNLDSVISSGTLITLVNENDEVIVSFKADENFRTLVISSDKLVAGTYYLYKDGTNTGTLENSIYQGGEYTKGTKISVSNSSEFKVTGIVTSVGSNNQF